MLNKLINILVPIHSPTTYRLLFLVSLYLAIPHKNLRTHYRFSINVKIKMSIFSTVEGFTFPCVINDEILLQDAIYDLPLDLVKHIMKFVPTLFNTFENMVYRYNTDEPFEIEYPYLMDLFFDALSPVMGDELYHYEFPHDENYRRSGTEYEIISFYQYAMASVWYIYHQIDPYRQKNYVKNVVIQHLTVILHEVLSTGNREMVFDLDVGFGRRLGDSFVWSDLQHYVSSLMDGTMDEDYSYPLFDILDSLCFKSDFCDTKDALECLRHFYIVASLHCD